MKLRILIIILLLAISGCTSDIGKELERRAFESGDNLVILEPSMELPRGSMKENALLIVNTYEEEKEFHAVVLENTKIVNFKESSWKVPGGKSRIVRFNVSSNEDFEQGIKINDNNNNAYAFAKLSVKVI